jgi:hypothetical protein
MVRLDGRFQSQVSATRSPGGAVTAECAAREEAR